MLFYFKNNDTQHVLELHIFFALTFICYLHFPLKISEHAKMTENFK